MTKLTTERLEKFVNDIKTDGMCDITDYQVALALRQLLAYEQAADRPVGEIFRCSGNKTLRWWNDVPEGTVLYAAPVLPKQPERLPIISERELFKVWNNDIDCPIAGLEPSNAAWKAWIFRSALEKPVMLTELLRAINLLLDSDGSRGCFDALEQHRAKTELERLLAAVQQNEPQNIPENIPAQPVIPEQPEFYTKPDRFLPECLKPEEISGGRRNSRIAELMGWFDRYYSGKANPKWLKPHVAELCYYILTVPQLSAQPVSEPYKFPVGYFSYGTEHGFSWHQTAKQATDDAEAMIDDYRGDACDGWSEETDNVCWGVILQQATKVNERPRTDDDNDNIAPHIDTVCDYALLPAQESE
ncbi:hypothetical protein EYY86_13765 [Hafnia paralvei]|uniref:hypothetical protein n=1 Tax=Hafnia paralvei TaxID=546367 RepID=UPI001034623A|nr:hypothetical protein [Hafnia paralvei]TBM13352.1 hypothetical protein EYY86_13765 [Hafnia paralvei]